MSFTLPLNIGNHTIMAFSSVPNNYYIYSTDIGEAHFLVSGHEATGLMLTAMKSKDGCLASRCEILHSSILPNSTDRNKLYLMRYHQEPRFDLSFFTEEDFRAFQIEFGIKIYEDFASASFENRFSNKTNFSKSRCCLKVEKWAIENRSIAERIPLSGMFDSGVVKLSIASFLRQLNNKC